MEDVSLDGQFKIGFFFFFQAEDGIRDHCVTGVQTCALPIWYQNMPMPGHNIGALFVSILKGSLRRKVTLIHSSEIGRASCRERV